MKLDRSGGQAALSRSYQRASPAEADVMDEEGWLYQRPCACEINPGWGFSRVSEIHAGRVPMRRTISFGLLISLLVRLAGAEVKATDTPQETAAGTAAKRTNQTPVHRSPRGFSGSPDAGGPGRIAGAVRSGHCPSHPFRKRAAGEHTFGRPAIDQPTGRPLWDTDQQS